MSGCTHEGLVADVARRIDALRESMQEASLDALIVAGRGAPGACGAIRYLTNARIWEGPAFVVLGRDDPSPWLLTASSYQACWSRRHTTTQPERVIATADLVHDTAALARRFAGPAGRIGVAKANDVMSVTDHGALLTETRDNTLVDITPAFDRLRQVKSTWELAAIREGGGVLDEALATFADVARVGRPYLETCGQAEALVRAHGSFWGRTKIALGPVPYTVPPDVGAMARDGDVVTIELVFESRWGYWHEMTAIGGFGGLSDGAAGLLDAYGRAFSATANIVRPNATFSDLSGANDRAIASAGLGVTGKHTPDAHSTGLDGSDGPSSIDRPDFVLEPDMVLSFHPGTQVDDGHAMLVSDNVQVTPSGGFRLSPDPSWRYGFVFGG